MNCFVCKDNMKEGLTSHVVNLDSGCTIIIKNVPCMKCTQCGEVWYNGKVMAQLERVGKTPEVEAESDEVEAIAIGHAEFARGEYVSFDEIDWDAE